MRKKLLFLNQITLPNKRQSPKSRGLFSFAFFLLFFQFAQAQIDVTFDVTEPTCFGHPTGSATAIVTGGLPPYTYMWNNGTMGPTISNVTAGTYTVTVSDSGGAVSIKNVTIIQPTLVQVMLTANVCEIPIVITAEGSGGLPGYEYNWSTGQTGPVISVPNPGTYCVTMTDQNLCGATRCITVDVNALDVDVVATNVSCPGENDGQVQAIPSGGTPPYMYQWSNGATTQVVTGLSTGTYTVTVTDAAGCMAEASGTVSAPPPLVATATSAEGVCPGESNGSAMASGSGGTPPYTYEWNTGATTQVITGLSPGTYTVTVTDSNDCEAVASTTIQQYSGVAVTIDGTEVICGAEDAGSATATPTAGTAPFTYQWSTGATTQTITDLPEGTFSVTVTDANGCTATAEIGITIVDDFILDIVIQNPLCPGDATGSILAEGWGGTPPYIYEWSTGLTGTPLLENVGAGNYSVTVTDQNGCQLTEDFTLVDPAAVEVSISGTANVCPGEFTGVAMATGSGGLQPYTYEWSTGATTQMITGLGAGTYTVTLTDANDCEAMASVTIGVHEGVTAVIVGTDLVCGVDELGMATATATSGTPPFTYLWSTGATTQVINDLPAGTYSVTITDSNGCTDSDQITIDIIDDFILDIVIQNPRCPEEETGSILAEGWGGTPPYIYEWSTGLTGTPLLENVGAGTYSVTVTDQNGCQLMETFTLTDPPALIASISGSGGVCPGENTGSAMAMGMGGTPPYSYEWNTGATMQMLFGLSAGTYSVTITDANDCEAEASVVIEAFEGVTAVITGTEVVCDPDDLGEATASATSGTPPFTYEWSNGAITPTISNLPAGTYSVTITDANGCTDTAEITITIIDDFILDIVVQNPLCPGDENGSILAEGWGGTPPYIYQWSTGLTGTPLLENVGAGTYSVTVTEQNGCKLSQEFTIVDPPLLTVNVTSTTDVCPGESDGSATAMGVGGTPPYTYEWSTGATTQTINNLAAGTYTVTVTDANECEATAEAVIEAFEGVTVEVTGMNIVCAPGLGIAAAEATSGTPPFSYLWSTGATTQTIMNLLAGTYSVTVSDANGCEGEGEIIIEIIDDLEVNLAPRDVLCFGEDTGSVLAQASGGSAPYAYLWSTGATTSEITNVPAGTYSVTVTDANGCTATASATVNEPPALDLDLAVTDVSCPGEDDGELVITATGGTPPYTYFVNGMEVPGNVVTGLSGPATLNVTVRDANFCEVSGSITLDAPDEIELTLSPVDLFCAGDMSGAITSTVSGGTMPYTYAWSNGATTANLSNVAAGTYTLTVTDANGCTATATAMVSEPGPINLTLETTDVLCVDDNSGAITSTVTGGTSPYTYEWSNGATTADISGLAPGTYTVTVTDANECEATASATIEFFPGLNLTPIATTPDCFGEMTGAAAVVVGGGTPPFTYLWSTGSTDEALTGLSAGVYEVTVTDAVGCTGTEVVGIANPALLVGQISDASTQDISCSGDANGEATIDVMGGTPPYTYIWSNGATTQTVTGLAPGTYTVTATDANGCVVTASTTLEEPEPISVDVQVTDVFCVDDNSGAITTTVSGGTMPYTYIWSNGAVTASISGVAPGSYTVTVTDANDCEATVTATVEFFPGLNLTPVATSPDCFGQMTGTATVLVEGGTPPFSYLWSTGSTAEVLTDLSAGAYEVTVTDAVGCSAMTTVDIAQPDLLAAVIESRDLTCTGIGDGEATCNAMGGTPPYSYLWNTGQTTQTITNLPAGMYTVTVTDSNGCEVEVSVTINEPDPIVITIDSPESSTCDNDDSGEASITVTGGTPPYTYLWSNGATTPSITNLAAGTYRVTVTDSQDCVAETEVIITAFPSPVCIVQITNPVSAAGNDGALSVMVTGGTPPFTFQWSTGQTTQTISGLAPGTYGVIVTDANGCQTTCTATLVPPARLGDFVWLDEDRDGIQDPGEPGIPGVMVILQIPDGGGFINIDTTFTDADGFYFFDVVPGEYKVTFIAPGGLVFSPSNQGANDALDSDADPVMGMTGIYTIGPGEINLTIDAGLYTKCDNITDPGVVGPNQFLCGPGNVPDPIVNIELPSGGSGAIEYLWMSSTVPGPFNVQTWQIIPGATGPSYTPGALSETTYFARCARRECCTIYLESNIVTVEVGSVAVAEIQGPSFFCLGESESYFAVGTGPGAVVEWTMPTGLSPQTATGTQVNLTASSHGSFEITLQVTENGCTSTDTKTITVTSSPIYCGAPMPLNAEITDEAQGEVLLSWMTEEFLSDHTFTVEYATDGEHFADLAQAGSPTAYLGVMSYYEHEHAKAKRGRNLYRLRIESPEGRIFYSEEAEVIFYGDSKIALLYPNPVEDIATLEIFETFGESMLLELINSKGQQVWAQQVEADTKQLQLNLSQLPSGTYFIKMNYSRAGHKVLKLVKK